MPTTVQPLYRALRTTKWEGGYDRRRARLEQMMQRALKVIGGVVAAAAGIYGGYAVITYVRFGRVSGKTAMHPLQDQLMPEYEVRERHSVRVAASADITLAAAREISFHDSHIIRMILALREIPGRLLGGPAPSPSGARSSMW